MCVAKPGRIVEISGDNAVVDVSGNRINANISVISPKVGDFVLLHAGYAIEIVSMDQAMEIEKLFKEMEDALNE